MAVAEPRSYIPTFPATEIESQIRALLAEKVQVQTQLQGGGGNRGPAAGISQVAEPEIDSLVAVEVLCGIEPLVPFDLPDSFIRPGGYSSVDDFLANLLPRLQRRWQRHHEGKSHE